MKYLVVVGVVLVALLGGFWLFGGESCEANAAACESNSIQEVSVAEQAIQDIQSDQSVALIDVRTQQEWDEGHAKGAQLFELARLQAGELPEVPKDQPVYVYCRSGNRSAEATTILQDAGFTDVRDIGAFTAWQTAGGDTE